MDGLVRQRIVERSSTIGQLDAPLPVVYPNLRVRNISHMVVTSRSITRGGVWALVSSGVGYHLDNLGRWVLSRAPAISSLYAAFLAPRVPSTRPQPDWRFAGEYYGQRLWWACRRGALWEAAKKIDPPMKLVLSWYDGMVIDVTLGNDNSLCLYVCGSFEPNEFSFLHGFLQPGMVFIDVGANDGYYSLFAARRVGPNGKVVAVEPSTRERVNLKRNIVRNRFENVRIVPAALGAESGDADLLLAHGAHSGHNTLGTFAHDDVTPADLERVTVKTLDMLAEELEIDRIDFVKIDVEGAEASVIAGARHVLNVMRPVMLLEINEALSGQRNGVIPLLSNLRREFGYEILVFSSLTGLLEPYVDGGPLSANVVAAPNERVAELSGGIN
jgi:FkbM family methyltransferase